MTSEPPAGEGAQGDPRWSPSGDPGDPHGGQAPPPPPAYQPPYPHGQQPFPHGQQPFPHGQQPYPQGPQQPYPQGDPAGYPSLPANYALTQWGYQPALAPYPSAPPTLNVLALVSLILSLIGGTVISLVLGVVALTQIRRTGQRGKPLAVIGVVLSSLSILAVAAVFVLAALINPTRVSNGQVTRSGTILVSDIRVGDCLEKWATGSQIGEVTVVPCTTTHDAEVFHTFTIPGTDFPGDREATATASTTCLSTAKTKLKATEQPNVKIAYLKPLADSWNQGDHSVACVAVAKAGTLSRSIRA